MDEEKSGIQSKQFGGKKATFAITMLKAKIATTPTIKHFDPDRIPVIVLYASKWSFTHHFCSNTMVYSDW